MKGRLIAVGAALLWACAPTPPRTLPPPVRDVYFRSPPAAIWDALLVTVTDGGATIETMERASWFLRTAEASFDVPGLDSLVDCGKDGLRSPVTALPGTTYLRMTVLLRPDADSTGVRLQTAWRWSGVIPGMVRNPQSVTCVSRGALERRYLRALEARLAPR